MKTDEQILKEAKEIKKVVNTVFAVLSFAFATIGGISFIYGLFTFIKTTNFSREVFSSFILLFCGLVIFLTFFTIFLLIGFVKHILMRIERLESKIRNR